MQEVSTNLQNMIDGGIQNTPGDVTWDWAELIEIYSPDYVLPEDGFLYSYADATICFSNISEEDYAVEVESGLFIPTYRWNSIDYIRQVASFGEIEKTKDESPNNVRCGMNLRTLRVN